MKLYGYWRSSASWRVRIALHLKGLDFDNVPVHLVNNGGEQRMPEHLARNPMAQVPVLEVVHDGVVHHLGQSLAILQYLEQIAPQPALLPADPIQRAQAWQLAEVVNSGIQPLQNLSVLQRLTGEHGVDRLAWGSSVMVTGFVALERLAAKTAGHYLVGDRVSIADLCLVPQVYNARRFNVDLAPFPTLLAVDARCADLPAFQAAHPDRQPDAVIA